jgi:hypothetical protein
MIVLSDECFTTPDWLAGQMPWGGGRTISIKRSEFERLMKRTSLEEEYLFVPRRHITSSETALLFVSDCYSDGHKKSAIWSPETFASSGASA